MAIITIPYTFAAGATIIASQHNSNFSTIYNDYNGNIDNTNVVSNAAIAYSKLNVSNSIVNADVNTSAAIANTKLNLASITGTINIGTASTGRIFYDNGTSIVGLTAGTTGYSLVSQGTGSNPTWSTSGFSLISNTSMSAVANSGDIAITNTNLYLVAFHITTLSVADIILLRINNDTGSVYQWVRTGTDTNAGTTASNSTGTTSIGLCPTAKTTDNPIDGYFYISPQGITTTKPISISGVITYELNASSNFAFNNFYGSYANSATATSFRMIASGGNNMTGNIYLYKLGLA